jgi:hypothetical protein
MHPYFRSVQWARKRFGGAMRNVWLGLALVPYLAAAGMDAWMHERRRRVPRVEQCLHAALAAGMTAFLAAVFMGHAEIALGALAAFLAFLAWDELGFHRAIASSERRVHLISWMLLAGFVAAWWWIDLR